MTLLPALGIIKGMERNQPVQSIQEVQDRLSKLPEFSQQVYQSLQKGLYAEPFFSDVQADDLAKTLGVSPLAINGALGHLMAAGLVYSEEFSNGFKRKSDIFLHTYEHDEFQTL